MSSLDNENTDQTRSMAMTETEKFNNAVKGYLLDMATKVVTGEIDSDALFREVDTYIDSRYTTMLRANAMGQLADWGLQIAVILSPHNFGPRTVGEPEPVSWTVGDDDTD